MISVVTNSRWTSSHLVHTLFAVVKGSFVIQFGEMVGQRREALELSQEELSSRAELHRTAITMIERAKRSSTLETIEKLALALQTQPSQLIPDIELRRRRR